MVMPKLLHTFTDPLPSDPKGVLGGKGANLNRMAAMGLPVPPGFTIPTNECIVFQNTKKLRPSLMQAIWREITEMEQLTGQTFGGRNPLLVSVRSGAAISMPGMMETILNLGLNDRTVECLAALTNEDFAWDSYRRFISMYCSIVGGIPETEFHERTETVRALFNGHLTAEASQFLVRAFKKIAKQHKFHIPSSPRSQLRNAIMAVFRSWNAPKAASYRRIEGIPDHLGTAVNIQKMVFGNYDYASGTGVAFSRNPNTGDNEIYGDFLVNAQGEDVVAGTHNTRPINDMIQLGFATPAMELRRACHSLEKLLEDAVDVEFTIESGKFYMLQARVAKRNPQAALKIAASLLDEGVIGAEEAKQRIDSAHEKWKNVTEPSVPKPTKPAVATGLAASPGWASGKATFTSKRAMERAENGEKVILVRYLTEPSDIEGMAAAEGILTASGGLVSHAAVVARGWGKPCVVGATALGGVGSGSALIGSNTITEDTVITINGATGEVFL